MLFNLIFKDNFNITWQREQRTFAKVDKSFKTNGQSEQKGHKPNG